MEVTDGSGAISAASPSGTATLRRVSLFDQININVFWIANNFHWQALLAIVIPSMAVKYLGKANVVLILFAFSPIWFSSSALLITFIMLFLLLQFTNNLANSPWSAIIVDKVPHNQRGVTSGFYGLFTLLGLIFGSLIAGIIVNKNDALPLYNNEIVRIFFLIAIVQIVLVVYTVITV